MISKRMKHMRRYRQIAAALARNGFGYFVKEVGLDQVFSLPRRVYVNQRHEETSKQLGRRLRSFLEELGPTFIKVGQVASMRPDLFPDDIIEELSSLQDELDPFSYEDVQAIVRQDFGADVEELFASFDREPLGAASIGQVHKAQLKTGEHVAVKVRRPGVYEQIHTDLEILEELAKRAEKRFDWATQYQVTGVLEEFKRAIMDELDYETEGLNADLMRKQFQDWSSIIIPTIYWDYSSKQVLTMEFVEGYKLDEVDDMKAQGFDCDTIAETMIQALYHQIFKDGLFHADPHQGNFFITENQSIALMDFGLVGRLSRDMKSHLASLFIGVVRQDAKSIVKTIKKMGITPDDLDEDSLRRDIEQVMVKYYDVPLKDISLGESITDLYQIAQEYQIYIQPDLSLVGKTMFTMENVIETLAPDINMIEVAEPYGKDLLRQKYNPKRAAEKLVDQLGEYADAAEDLPEVLQEINAIAKKRKVPIDISFQKEDSFMRKLDQVSNRLSFSIVLLSFSLIMVGLMVGSALSQQHSMVWNIPAIEIGFVIALLMFLWMIYSIFRSGRF
ncbi:ubiquinone biosynthesis protein [Alkalibacillus flavidus]|uniref:Ubiquinone biosynthesis protein n=1 Tax=Alkalibacillus flavidus TaxID=546021 RepID=A0ABV2KWE7_9BACI